MVFIKIYIFTLEYILLFKWFFSLFTYFKKYFYFVSNNLTREHVETHKQFYWNIVVYTWYTVGDASEGKIE